MNNKLDHHDHQRLGPFVEFALHLEVKNVVVADNIYHMSMERISFFITIFTVLAPMHAFSVR
jgi:hypothetical protein